MVLCMSAVCVGDCASMMYTSSTFKQQHGGVTYCYDAVVNVPVGGVSVQFVCRCQVVECQPCELNLLVC